MGVRARCPYSHRSSSIVYGRSSTCRPAAVQSRPCPGPLTWTTSLTYVLIAAAFCPHPPLLVPELAAGAAPELASLRAACGAALDRLLAAAPAQICVLGTGPSTQRSEGCGSLLGYGLDRRFALGPAGGSADLPLSLTVGAYLLAGREADGVIGQSVHEHAPPAACARLGRSLAARERLGLLVMGDGSARRTTEAPGAFDERATPFDADVARMLGSADTAGLLELDQRLAQDVLAAGRAAWQVAAAAASQPLTADLLYDDDPYGVGYFVATWLAA